MSATHNATTTRGGIDMPALSAAIRRALPPLVVFAALVGAVVYLLLDRTPPLYRAVTDIALAVAPAGPDVVRKTLDGEVQLIRSRDLAGQVVSALALGDAPEYRAADGATALHSFLVTIGLARDLATLSPEERVLALYDRNLDVEAVGRTPVIRIGFWSADPVLAARAANAVAAAYAALRQSATDEALALEAEATRLRAAIADGEARAASLRDTIAGMPPVEAGAAERLRGERDAANSALDAARSDAGAIRAALAAGRIPGVAAFRDDPAVAPLLDEQMTLRAALGDELAARPLGSARAAEIGARLAEIAIALRDAAAEIAARLESQAADLARHVAAIEADLADLDARDAAGRELESLENTIAADRGKLDAALRRQAALTQGGALPTSVRVLREAAPPPAPEWPDLMALTAAAFAVALALGIVIVVLRDLINGSAFRRMPFEPLAEVDTPLPAAGRMRRRGDDRVARAPPTSPSLAPEVEAESSLGDVADSIAGRRRIVVTLAEDSDAGGRPLAAVALARALSGRDRSVVLVDLQGDGADETAMGEADGLVGFSDLLSGEASFAQAIFRDRRSRAHFIPSGSRPPAADALAGERLATLLTALEHTYDHVVIDCPDPAIARLAPGADAALVASDYGGADPRTVRAVARIARVSDAHIYHLIVEPSRRSPEPAEAA